MCKIYATDSRLTIFHREHDVQIDSCISHTFAAMIPLIMALDIIPAPMKPSLGLTADMVLKVPLSVSSMSSSESESKDEATLWSCPEKLAATEPPLGVANPRVLESTDFQ